MPLPAEIRRVHEPRPVGRDVRPRLPAGLLAPDELRRPRAIRGNAHDVPGAVGDLAVGDEDDRLPVRGPGRIDRVIERAVVVARHCASMVGNQRPDLPEAAVPSLRDVRQEVAGANRGDPGEPRSVRRPSGLDVDRAARGERRHRAAREVEQHQLHRPAVVADEDDPLAVRRPVGLVVGAVGIGELLGDGTIYALPPERALHRVDQPLPVRRPRRRTWPGSQLRKVELAVVVRMRQVDLRQHRLARADGERRHREQHGAEQDPKHCAHSTPPCLRAGLEASGSLAGQRAHLQLSGGDPT